MRSSLVRFVFLGSLFGSLFALGCAKPNTEGATGTGGSNSPGTGGSGSPGAGGTGSPGTGGTGGPRRRRLHHQQLHP